MSGTSLDGVDIAFCEFRVATDWSFELLASETIPYEEAWRARLVRAPHQRAAEFSETDCAYGSLLGKLVKEFCEKRHITPDFVASHGHTIFHQPRNGVTTQIGSGAYLAASAGFPVVCDFRRGDVALGGQGAPLVPVGDKLLFTAHAYCLNLGGIANVSYDAGGDRIAYDICPCNLVLNKYAATLGLPYDSGGELAAGGRIQPAILKKLEQLPYYRKSFPKSLGREEAELDFFPLLDTSGIGAADILATFCEHIAMETGKALRQAKGNGTMLVTGGGAFNAFLLQRIRHHASVEVVVPDKKIVEFKEAIIFAFLGVLRMRNENNCLMSVTGASRDSCGGAIYQP
jgi:anhydro-N-acetylmuramic acid kinase